MPTFWLSFHAPYACRHSGACCSSGWDIDIEQSRVAAITAAIADGRLTAPAQWHRRASDAPADVGGVLALSGAGRCVFHRDPGCAIHSALGYSAMPSACQHFPRIALVDPRGVFVTLSHYCPTAASLLFAVTEPVSIVEGPSALPAGVLPEGLDAREALPPLETPRRLMDWASYGAWERRTVAVLTSTDSPEEALDALDPAGAGVSDEALVAIARAAVPLPYRWPSFARSEDIAWNRCGAVVGRYLAAHAFASWTAYQGTSLRCTVIYLRLVLAVLKRERARAATLLEAIRQSDLLLRHLADRQAIADRLSEIAAR